MGERRHTPRVDLLADLHGHIVTLDEQVRVRQLSLGGLTVETTAPLSPRLVHDFRISFGNASTTVHGRVIHSRVVIDGDTVSYVAGIQFVDPGADALDLIRLVIDQTHAASE
jgi:hypothetical protein